MSSLTFGFGDPCLPTRVEVAPSGPQWVHEVKHDGYRLMVRRTPEGVRIKTRNGYDWSDRYPLIIEAAGKLSATSFVLDGEGVILGADGVSDFDKLHWRRHDGEVQLLGFDLLELDGTDLRREPLTTRKTTLASLLRPSHDGIQLVEHIEAADGATVFEHAWEIKVDGVVCTLRDLRETAIYAARFLQQRNPSAKVEVRDLRDGSAVPFEHSPLANT